MYSNSIINDCKLSNCLKIVDLVPAKYQHPDEETVKLVTDVGFATVFYSTTGVYHYRVRNSNVCSVIVSPGEKVSGRGSSCV